MIAIVDYGMGNIHSVQKALESLGGRTCVAHTPGDIDKCDKVVLPGVGAFDDAVLELERKGLARALTEHVQNKKIFLGICLGLQLLFERSEEAKKTEGLGLLKGAVVKFKNSPGLKVPHMGWNQLTIAGECPLLKGIEDNSFVYFCHSYYPAVHDNTVVAASTDYGVRFPSVVWKGTIYGMQFHPEKSQGVGIRILKNFIRI